jgi:hypothetical protein
LTLASLPNLSSRDWGDLNAPGIVGEYGAFDPIANLPWAATVAAAWKPDAVVYRADLTTIGRDGTMNLLAGPRASVEYWIVSRKCLSDHGKSPDTLDPKKKCELRLEVESRGGAPPTVEVLLEANNDPVGSLTGPPPCALPQALASLEREEQLPPSSVVNATLRVLSSGHPAWYFTNVGSKRASGSVNGVTCKYMY